MNTIVHAVVGTVLFLIGSIKTYLHASTDSVLVFPTCTGRNVLVNVSDGSLFTQMHCWGCYVALAGLIWFVIAFVQHARAKRLFVHKAD